MNDNLIEWINKQLNERRLSIRKLAGEMGVSHSYVSRVLSGKIEPALKFYLALAEALDEPIEEIFRVEGILPSLVEDDKKMTLSELVEIGKRLTPEQRQEVLDYVDFLLHKQKKRDSEASSKYVPASDHA